MRHLFFLSSSCVALAFLATPAAAQVVEPCCAPPPAVIASNFDLGNYNGSTVEQPTRPAGPEATRVASIEPSTSSQVEVSGNVAVESGRIFQDQRFTLTRDPVMVGDINIAYRGLNLNVWRAQPFDGDPANTETDVTASGTKRVGRNTTTTFQVGVYFIPNTAPVYEAKLTVSHTIGPCELALSGEVMRGGFSDEVIRAEASCGTEIAPRVTVSATPSLSLSDYGGGFSVGGEVSVSYRLNGHLSLSGYAKGYTSSIGSAGIFGLRASISG